MEIRTLTRAEEIALLKRFGKSLDKYVASLREQLDNPALSADERLELEKDIAKCAELIEQGDGARRAPQI
jgi:hypothetical protein